MSRPLIGITGPSTFSSYMWEMTEKLLGFNYVLLHHDQAENLNHWANNINGIIFAGGKDIHPVVYNNSVTVNNSLSNFDYARDLREIKLLTACLEKKIPILGVCRGHQLMGLYQGMRLLPDISGSYVAHNPSKANINLAKEEPTHSMSLINCEEYYAEYKPQEDVNLQTMKLIRKKKDNKKEIVFVNSFHHQAILLEKNPPPDVKIIGVSELSGLKIGNDDNIKNVEFMSGERWISVQWHPEYDWDSNVHSAAVLNKFKQMVIS